MRTWSVWTVGPVVAACVLASALPSPAPAQTPSHVSRGDKVRVVHTDPCCRTPQIGALVSIDLDSLVVQADGNPGGTLIALPRQSVRYLEVAYDRDSYALRGAGIGASLGAAVGAIAVLSDSCEGDEICGSLKAPVALGAAAVGAWVGLFAGALIGTSIPRVHWVRVPLPARVGLVPSRGRISLALLVGTYRVPRP